MFWMFFALGDASNAYELARTGAVTSSVTLHALTQAIWVVPVGQLGVYTVLLFPDGRLPSRRWRPFAWFAGTTMILIQVTFVFAPGHLEGHPGVLEALRGDLAGVVRETMQPEHVSLWLRPESARKGVQT